MRVLGVVDLLQGQAVHAREGRRDRYQPVQVSGGAPIGGDPVLLARAYLDRLGLGEIYLADLDAIVQRRRQDALVSAVAGLGAPVWLDAGVSNVDSAEAVLDLGVDRLIVALETLTSFDALRRISAAIGSARMAFSLDLRDGVPAANGDLADHTPEELAARAADCGATAMTVIDLHRVGSGRGIDLAMLARVRAAVPGLPLIAGGGVRTIADVDRLAGAGCDGVLLATSLHDGTISRVDLERFIERSG